MYWIAIGAVIFFIHIMKSVGAGIASYPDRVDATQRANRVQYLRSRLIDDGLEAQMKREAVDERLFDKTHKLANEFISFVFGPDYVPEWLPSYDRWWYMSGGNDYAYIMIKMAKHGKLMRQYVSRSGCTDRKTREEMERLLLAVEEELNRHHPDIPVKAVIDMSKSLQYHISVPLREYIAEHGYGKTDPEWYFRWQDARENIIL